jgi:hypothetical protein
MNHRPLPDDLAAVLRWLKERYPTAAKRIELTWVEDPAAAESELRGMVRTYLANVGRVA